MDCFYLNTFCSILTFLYWFIIFILTCIYRIFLNFKPMLFLYIYVCVCVCVRVCVYIFLHVTLFNFNTLLEEVIPRSSLLKLLEQFIVLKLMGKLDIDYSLKNMPIPSNDSYLIKPFEKTESVVQWICWRAHLILQEKHENRIRREDFGFKSKSTPPQFLDMIPNLKLRYVKDTFHKKLKEDISKITSHDTFLSSQTKQVISTTT